MGRSRCRTDRADARDLAEVGDAVPFFDESRVPIETITVISAEMKQLRPDQFEVIGEKVSDRLAQRPGSYVVLKYGRAVIKVLDTQTILNAPAPVGVLEGSRADVSFAAGLLMDKFAWQGFTPSNQYIKALNCARERRLALEVFLTDPDVAMDTNHVERALRVIPMGSRLRRAFRE